MERRKILIEPEYFPAPLQEFLAGAEVYDSSCSAAARVWFIDRDGGYYLKSAAPGSLNSEALMTDYFHRRGLAAEVLHYGQTDADWLLTRRIPGEDCLDRMYLDDPQRLSEALGTLLRQLHETDPAGCPVQNCAKAYLDAVTENYKSGKWHPSRLYPGAAFSCADDAWRAAQNFFGELKSDTLIHGDFCLPNILLDNWNFSGFIDLGGSGLGDRHIDLYWVNWSLNYNLKTDAYRARFLDAYGRDAFDPEILQAISILESFG